MCSSDLLLQKRITTPIEPIVVATLMTVISLALTLLPGVWAFFRDAGMMSEPRALGAMSGAIYNRDLGPAKAKLGRFVRHGSAAHDYWALTDGRLQVLAYRRLKPWDHAAGVLIHAEAGGYSRLLSGLEYDPVAPDQSGLLCAPDWEIWQEIQSIAAAP